MKLIEECESCRRPVMHSLFGQTFDVDEEGRAGRKHHCRSGNEPPAYPEAPPDPGFETYMDETAPGWRLLERLEPYVPAEAPKKERRQIDWSGPAPWALIVFIVAIWTGGFFVLGVRDAVSIEGGRDTYYMVDDEVHTCAEVTEPVWWCPEPRR